MDWMMNLWIDDELMMNLLTDDELMDWMMN